MKREDINNGLLVRVGEINERAMQVKDEIDSLEFRMELGKIDSKLYRMKKKTCLYELSLLEREVDRIREDINLTKLLSGLGVSFDLNKINLN
jgi:hypothetical protein